MNIKRYIWMVTLGLLFGFVGLYGCNCDEVQLGQEPKLQVRPTAIVFPVIEVGQTSQRVVEISNKGILPLLIDKLILSPKGDKSYRLLNPPKTPIKLEADKSIKVTVEFKPVGKGQPKSELWIDSNDPDKGHFIVPISTSGNAPQISVKPTRLQFGFVGAGQTAVKTVEVQNIGSADLSIDKIWITSVSKDFGWKKSALKLPKKLAPKEKVTLEVSYSPSDSGGDIGELWIGSDDPAKPKVRVLLTGKRSEPDIKAEPTLLDFGGVSPKKSGNLSLKLINRGGAKLVITSIEFSAQSSKEFTKIHAPPTLTVNPGQSVVVLTFYNPKDKGIDNGLLIIKSNDPDTPELKVRLLGQSPAAGILVRPLLLDFGNLPKGSSKSLTFKIINVGKIAIDIRGLVLTGSSFKIASQPSSYPHKLQPTASVVVQVTYSPLAGQRHQGKVDVQSDDPDQPSILVTLLGNVIPTPPCFLKTSPSLINFGLVALGKSQERSVEITNIGSGTCWLFESRMGASSNLDFRLSAGEIVLPVALGPNAKYSAKVAYAPQRPGPAQGTFEVVHGDSLLGRFPPLQVPLSAIGEGPRLCITPATVDFGGVAIGGKQSEVFQVRSCGTKPVTISSMTLPVGEYSITKKPTLPLQLAVGKSISITVEYAPKDAGLDTEKVEMKTNAAGTPIYYTFLRGYGIPKGQQCGALSGRICAPDGTTWLANATVSVKLPNGTIIKGQTDTDGYFYLPCVPQGQHSFDVRKGSFSTNFSAKITNLATNTIKKPQCIDASKTKIAVIWGEYDEVQNILDRLKLVYTFYQDPSSILTSLSKMKKFDIIFLNCGMDETVLSTKVANNLRQFVKDGGSVYASDFSYDFIEVAWPNEIDWLGNDATRNAAEKASSAKVQAKVLSSLLINRLGGRKQVTINYALCPCAAADKAGSRTKVLISGNRSKSGNPNQPLAFYFKPDAKGGNVVYTTFHNNEQVSRTIDIILKYLIFEL